MKSEKLIETKVWLTKEEDLKLEKLAESDGGRSKTNYATKVVREKIKNEIITKNK